MIFYYILGLMFFIGIVNLIIEVIKDKSNNKDIVMMNSFYAEAQYVGSLGELHRRGIYSIEVWQDWRGRYCVAVTHGYERKQVADYRWKYRNLKEMLMCWRDIRPQSFYRFDEK